MHQNGFLNMHTASQMYTSLVSSISHKGNNISSAIQANAPKSSIAHCLLKFISLNISVPSPTLICNNDNSMHSKIKYHFHIILHGFNCSFFFKGSFPTKNLFAKNKNKTFISQY